jgi:hypothetical protein
MSTLLAYGVGGVSSINCFGQGNILLSCTVFGQPYTELQGGLHSSDEYGRKESSCSAARKACTFQSAWEKNTALMHLQLVMGVYRWLHSASRL